MLRSAQKVGVGRRTVYEWLADEQFKALYNEAHEDALDQLEEEARRRAVDGVLKPVYQRGRLVGRIREYSDTLLITLLKGKRPDTFRERFEHTGKGGKPLFPPVSSLSDDELQAEFLNAARALGLQVVEPFTPMRGLTPFVDHYLETAKMADAEGNVVNAKVGDVREGARVSLLPGCAPGASALLARALGCAELCRRCRVL